MAAIEDLTTEEIIFAVICMATGLLMCFFGYATFKIIIFLAGFYMGYWICYAIMESINVDYGPDEELIIFCSCLGAGLLVGLILLYLTTVGIVVLGALAGFFLACWILSFIDSSSPIHEELYTWIFICGAVRGTGDAGWATSTGDGQGDATRGTGDGQGDAGLGAVQKVARGWARTMGTDDGHGRRGAGLAHNTDACASSTTRTHSRAPFPRPRTPPCPSRPWCRA